MHRSQPQAFGGLRVGWGRSTAPVSTLQAWFRMWRCEPLHGPVSRLRGYPLIKLLLEPSVQAAGEDHPADLPGGERAESHENPIGFWLDAGRQLLTLGRPGELYPLRPCPPGRACVSHRIPGETDVGWGWGQGASSEKCSPKSMTFVLE